MKARNGETINIGDIIETVQETKFEVISIMRQLKIKDKDGYLFDLEDWMSPNIWIIGKVEKPTIL